MALPAQLKSARLTDQTDISTIEGVAGPIALMEQALADIFGISTNTAVTVSPFSCDNSGRLKKIMLLAGASTGAHPVGWRFRDSTFNTEYRIAFNNGVLQFDRNAGTEDFPDWSIFWSITTGGATQPGFSKSIRAQFARMGSQIRTLGVGAGADLTWTASLQLITPDAAGNDISGFASAPADGHTIEVVNVSNASPGLGFLHKTGSAQANQLALPGGVAIARSAIKNRSHVFSYQTASVDGGTGKWVLVGLNYSK